MKVRSSVRVVGPWAAAVLAIAWSSPLGAWDRDIHLSILRAAMAVSGAAEARVPLEYRDAVFREAVEPDAYDKDCVYHCAAQPREPGAEAAKILGVLTNPKIPLTRYQRAQTIGRYVHFVEDAVSPLEVRRGAAPKLLNFFANLDFVFFREARPITGDLAAALRQRASDVAWVNAGAGTSAPYVFRLVINTTADALLLLAPRDAASASAPDSGPPHFLVNRIDSGGAGKASWGEWTKTGHTYGDWYDGSSWTDTSGGYDTWSWTPGSRGGGQSFYKPNMLERKGMQLAELVAHQEPTGVTLKAIFFNNNELCATRVTMKAGSWTWTLPESLPPHALIAVTIDAPADILSRKLSTRGWSEQCDGLKISKVAMLTGNRRVYGNGGDPPRFDAVLREYDISHGSDKTPHTINFTKKDQ